MINVANLMVVVVVAQLPYRSIVRMELCLNLVGGAPHECPVSNQTHDIPTYTVLYDDEM